MIYRLLIICLIIAMIFGLYLNIKNYENTDYIINTTLQNITELESTNVKYFEKMISKAKDIGYDSIQFLSHSDMRCGYIAHEIIDVNGIGIYSCPSEDSSTKFYMGYKGRVSLRGCDATKPCLNTGLSK